MASPQSVFWGMCARACAMFALLMQAFIGSFCAVTPILFGKHTNPQTLIRVSPQMVFFGVCARVYAIFALPMLAFVGSFFRAADKRRNGAGSFFKSVSYTLY